VGEEQAAAEESYNPEEDAEDETKTKIKLINKKRRELEALFTTGEIIMMTFAFLVIVMCSAGLYF